MSGAIVPHKVHFTGENSFLRLSAEEGGAETTTCSHWRGLISPAGPGHVLFVQSDATDGEIRIYSDNEGFARFIQTIEETLHPDSFADKELPLIEASAASLAVTATASSPSRSSTETFCFSIWSA